MLLHRSARSIRPLQMAGHGKVGVFMSIWLESDAVALAVLVFGIAAVEWLAFSI